MSVNKSDIASAVGAAENSTFVVGESVFCRTVTSHSIGRIVRISECSGNVWLHLNPCISVEASGEFGAMFRTGKVVKAEPIEGENRVNTSACVEVFSWRHPVPVLK